MRSKKITRRQQLKQKERKVGLQLAIFTIGFFIVVGGLEIGYFWREAKAAPSADLSIHATLPKQFVAGQPFFLEATIKNLGTAEDRDITVNTAHGLDDFKSDDDAFERLHFQLDRKKNSLPILIPKESFKKELGDGVSLRPEDYENLMSGKRKLYFFSQIKYSDTFGVPHQADTCEYFDPSNSVMARCPTHNSFH